MLAIGALATLTACSGSGTPRDGGLTPVPGIAGAQSPAAGPQSSRPGPQLLRIPAIGVRANLLPLGLEQDGTVQVPPLDSPDAGWYRYSPVPGDIGPAVLLGHVDSAATGPSVFFALNALHPGDRVEVDRDDGSTASFRVDRVTSYPKSAFPTAAVYGRTDGPELRLITCGGPFDHEERSYRDNIVVFASVTGH